MLIAVGSNPTGRKLFYNLYFYIFNPLYIIPHTAVLLCMYNVNVWHAITS